MRFLICLVFLPALLVHLPGGVHGEILLNDTLWEGEILLEDDILVPQGVTLTVRAGSVITVNPVDSTKTDPEYMSSLTEITIRGTLRVEGTPEAPVIFRLNGAGDAQAAWAGIIVDGGSAAIRFCTIQDAEIGVWLLAGQAELHGSTLSANRYGLVGQGKNITAAVIDSVITRNEYGLLALDGAVVATRDTRIADNHKKDRHSWPADEPDPLPREQPALPVGITRQMGDEVLRGDVVWQGHVRINGRVRVPAGSRLIILPGTIVEFSRKDTNNDGIGENGLMLQGVLIAKGTAEKPIWFRSAEKEGVRGDWDAVNIINSDGARNIIEHCRFEDGYRGLHFHFSNVAVHNCVFRNNYRGIQFQESTVDLRANHFYANTSAIQARDSEIIFTGNHLRQNIFGANFFRAHLTISNNSFNNNRDFGLKVREGFPTITGNVFAHNRFGLMFSDTNYGVTAGNLMLHNGEAGLSMRSGANMEISGNFIQANGLSGISVRDVAAIISDNHFSENGERGLGLVSFQGSITRNIFSNNHLYAIGVEDGVDVSAPFNWFDQADIEPLIFDQHDDPARGRVHYEPAAEEPLVFAWPLADVPADLAWYGRISVPKSVFVPAGAALTIKPGARIMFAEDAGLDIRGRLLALGTEQQRISFTAANRHEPGAWGEIRLEYSAQSRFSNCDFQYATWGIHSHFSPLPVIGCSFRNNEGGIRFRSGPLMISNCLFKDNAIGIRSFRGTADIVNNVITGNAKGIFVRELGGGLLIKGNNIFDNLDYHIWVGDFNTEDIRAEGNWWGEGDPLDKFFDARREPGIGLIRYQPALGGPLEISITDRELL